MSTKRKTNNELYEAAITAIREMHGDTRVDLHTSLTNLRGLKDEISMLIHSVEQDLKSHGMED